jgi:hypothetical protein
VIPISIQHKEASENVIGGGYVRKIDNVLTFYGHSEHFGFPSLATVEALLMEELKEPFNLEDLLENITTINLVASDDFQENPIKTFTHLV